MFGVGLYGSDFHWTLRAVVACLLRCAIKPTEFILVSNAIQSESSVRIFAVGYTLWISLGLLHMGKTGEKHLFALYHCSGLHTPYAFCAI
jgi:hypothetical protein